MLVFILYWLYNYFNDCVMCIHYVIFIISYKYMDCEPATEDLILIHVNKIKMLLQENLNISMLSRLEHPKTCILKEYLL